MSDANKRSLSLQRAAHALRAIEELKAENKFGKYLSYVKALPANILRSGLGQAIAMELAGKDKGHAKLHAQMEDWLLTGWGKTSPYQDQETLITAIVGGDQAAYVRAQAEALAYLEWLKKFAVAFLDEDQTDTKQHADGARL